MEMVQLKMEQLGIKNRSAYLRKMAVDGMVIHLELPEFQKYYTSIEIQKGDTLWGIADEYAESCRMSTTDYVAELKSMNGLKEDVIHSGQHLTIMYCVPVTEVLAEK